MAGEDRDDDLTIEADLTEGEGAGQVNGVAAEGAETEGEPELAKLKADLEAERAEKDREREARLAAERREREASRGETEARAQVQDTNLNLINSAITTITERALSLRKEYAEAASAGDWEAAAEVQERMMADQSNLTQLRNGKTALENAPPPESRTITDPVESFARNIEKEWPQSARWVRDHPEYAIGSKYDEMIGAHNIALARGHKPDTPGYFDAIERVLGVDDGGERRESRQERRSQEGAREEAADPMADAASSGRRRQGATPPSAPPSRGGSGGGGNSRRITLSGAQREAAAMSGLTEEEYAKNLLAIQDQDKGSLQ